MIDLSILIPYIRKHEAFFIKLKFELTSQILPFAGRIELIYDNHEYDSIGTKRNRLLQKAEGKYTAFIDADDRIATNYIQQLMVGIDNDVDCCSLKGVITTNGQEPHFFEHSIRYNEYRTNTNADYKAGDVRYERYPNHLNTIRSSVAKLFKFPETNWGEDTDFATQIHKSGLLKTEHYIADVIYNYDYVPK